MGLFGAGVTFTLWRLYDEADGSPITSVLTPVGNTMTPPAAAPYVDATSAPGLSQITFTQSSRLSAAFTGDVKSLGIVFDVRSGPRVLVSRGSWSLEVVDP